jgi:hypothetical protein
MIDEKIQHQVFARIKNLLSDQSIEDYKNHELFFSESKHAYRFLIWKLRPINFDDFSTEVQRLVEQDGYQCIPGAWDVSTYNPETKTGYKVIALYSSRF